MRPVALICVAITLAGCTPALTPPKYVAAEIADAAMAAYDTNKDGKLDEKELENCPALKDMFTDRDYKGDKIVTRDDLEKYFKELLNSGVALLAVNCKVYQGDKPVSDVDVKFVPEKFHGGTFKTGMGKTDERGTTAIRVDGQPAPGLTPGFYRVVLSKKDADGKESIPAEFNERTNLGYQIRLSRKGAIRIEIP